MNWLLVVTAIILVLSALKGRRDGFIKTVFSMFTVLIALIVAVAAGPLVSKALQKNESLMNKMTQQISGAFAVEEGQGASKSEASDKNKKVKKDKGSQESFIRELPLPESLTKALLENNNTEAYAAMAVESFSEYVSRYLAIIILNAASFLLVFAVTAIALFVLSRALDLISKLPLINGLNKTAGLLAGVLNGLVVLWILCILLTMFSSTAAGRLLYGYINDSWFLSSIYNNNLLLRFIMNLARVLF